MTISLSEIKNMTRIDDKGRDFLKDVLAQVIIDQHRIDPKLYFNVSNSVTMGYNEDLRDVLLAKQPECQMCAVGAMFLTEVIKNNNCRVNELVCSFTGRYTEANTDLLRRIHSYIPSPLVIVIESVFMFASSKLDAYNTWATWYDASSKSQQGLRIHNEDMANLYDSYAKWLISHFPRLKSSNSPQPKHILIQILTNIIRNGWLNPDDRRITRLRDVKRRLRRNVQV